MKISYRTHPVLKILEEGNTSLIKRHDGDKIGYRYLMIHINKWFKKYLHHFMEITFLSIPFIEASSKAQQRLLDLYHDNNDNNLDQFSVKGTFVAGSGVTMVFREYNKSWGKTETAIFGFDINGYPLFSFVENEHTQNGLNGEGSISPMFAKLNDILPKHAVKWMQWKVSDMMVIDLFKKYAQVETKFLPAKKRVKDINCKYVNDTNSNITYLDSTWFTTLVKSDAFKVRGHFRLQPKKKDGEWIKELIWINEFQKNGYTAPARKLKDI